MKRLLSIPVLIFYLAGVMGVGINVGYCCGIPRSVKITCTYPGSNLTLNNGKPGKSCCTHSYSFFKLHDPQVIASAAQLVNLSWQPIQHPVITFGTLCRTFVRPAGKTGQWPPPSAPVPVFLKYSSLRI